MNVQVTHVAVHEPEAVRDIIGEAMEIADGCARNGERWGYVFQAACTLLGARSTLVAQPTPVDLGALQLPNGARR